METNQWQVLVVEDEDDSLQMVTKILHHHRIETHVARNGHQCMNMLQRVDPTLVIMVILFFSILHFSHKINYLTTNCITLTKWT